MTWLRRVGVWIFAAFAFVFPVWGWYRERKARQAADRRWAAEAARSARAARVAAEERATRERQAARDAFTRARIEAAVKPLEVAATESRTLGAKAEAGDSESLRELAARLNGGTPK